MITMNYSQLAINNSSLLPFRRSDFLYTFATLIVKSHPYILRILLTY